MINRKQANCSLFLITLGIPLLAEYIDVTIRGHSNLGFDILLYEPIDYFFMAVVLCLFIGVNTYYGTKSNTKTSSFIYESIVLYFLWFIVAFLSVFQLHVSLGGRI